MEKSTQNTENSNLQKNKQTAMQFLELVIGGEIDDAYEKYVDLMGKHHNVFTATGFPALRVAMKENESKFPKKQFKIKNVVGEKDLVVVHSHLVFNQGEAGLVTIHMFRFKNNKIIEMWDCGQPIPKDSPNKDGAF